MPERKITKVVIPAAGKGTRLDPLTRAIPKELVPLGRKPVLEHIVDECAECGITDALLVIAEGKEGIRTYFGERLGGVRFEYVQQPEQKGLADAIYWGKQFAGGGAFAVALGDTVIYTPGAVSPFRRALDTYEQRDASAVIVVENVAASEVSRYGIVKPDGDPGASFPISGLVEKPSRESAPSTYAIGGRYVFDSAIFDCIERTPRGAGGEYQITDAIRLMLDDGHKVWCVALGDDEARIDIGTFDAYFEAFRREIEKESGRSETA